MWKQMLIGCAFIVMIALSFGCEQPEDGETPQEGYEQQSQPVS